MASVRVTPPEWAALSQLAASPTPLAVPVRVTAVLGRARAPAGRWRALRPHDRVVLDRPQGPVELHVNGVRVGTAQVVLVDGQIGLRLLTWNAAEEVHPSR